MTVEDIKGQELYFGIERPGGVVQAMKPPANVSRRQLARLAREAAMVSVEVVNRGPFVPLKPPPAGVYAAVGLIYDATGQFLLVGRRELPDTWGLPGGKLEPGETPEEACAREVYEETGLRVSTADMVEVFSRPHRDQRVVVFRCGPWQGAPRQRESGIRVKWGSWEDLEQGALAPYHAELRKTIEQRTNT